MVLRLAGIAAFGVTASWRDIDLTAENRVQSASSRVVMKNHRREQIPVFRYRDCRHLQPNRLIQQFIDSAGAVEERVFGMEVKVGEIRH